MKKAWLAIVVTCIGCLAIAAEEWVYPGRTWERREPAEAGLDLDALSRIGEMMRKAKANGALIHKGYLVAEWTFDPPAGKRFNIQSCTKAITGAVLGLVLKDGLVTDLDAKVKEFYPDFEAGPYTDEITFRHLVTATSGIASKISPNLCKGSDYLKPGTANRYNSDHCHLLALALTCLYKTDLQEVLRKRILDTLQIEDGFEWGRHDGRGGLPKTVKLAGGKIVPAVAGYFDSRWSARDLARMGYLYLRDGKWMGKQILGADYVRECRTAIPFPVLASRPNTKDGEIWADKRYGLAWRGLAREDGQALWYMSGYGGQFCVVEPAQELVLVKVNNWRVQPFVQIEEFASSIWRLVPSRTPQQEAPK